MPSLSPKARRTTLVTTLTAALLAVPVVTPAFGDSIEPGQVAIEGAEVVTNPAKVKHERLQAVLSNELNGFSADLDDFEIFDIDGTTVTVPRGMTLTALEDEGGHLSAEFEVTDPGERSEPLASAQALGGMTRITGACAGRIQNNTGWIDYCYESWKSTKNQSWNGGNKQFVALNHWATFKSKSTWKMYKARIRAVPKTGSTSWVDWAPKADSSKGNCKTVNLELQARGVGVGSSATQCDEWDIGKFAESGRFDNTWFGSAVRKERHLKYMIMVARNPGTTNTWTLNGDFWAK